MAGKRIWKMYRIGKLILLCCLILSAGKENVSAAWPWGAKDLVTINGQSYKAEDYRQWWTYWKDEGTRVPEKLDDFIEWQLMVNEALVMELDREYEYKRKLDVFLRARARMLLKNEVVDSKIDIPEEAVRTVYQKDYSPVYHLDMLLFKTVEPAREMHDRISSGQVTFDTVAGSVGERDDMWFQKASFTPVKMRKHGFFAAVSTLEPGETTAPVEVDGSFAIFDLVEKVVPEEAEYERMKKNIYRDLWKVEEAKYTAELIDELKQKFEVRVDEEVYAAVTPDVSGEILEKPLVMTSKGNIPAKALVRDIRDEYRYRHLTDVSAAEAETIKKGFLNSMIAGALIDWESVDRHYEERQPFKDNYVFYGQRQLIKQLEKLGITPLVTISDEDIMQYYAENLDEFRKDTLISIASISDEENIIDKIWEEIRLGKDFFTVAQKYYTRIIPVQEIAQQDLDPAVNKALENLNKGDVSAPFYVNDRYAIIKLVERKQPEPETLDAVKDIIVQKLRLEKYQAARQEYIAKLYENAEIDINWREWKKVQKTLQEDGKE